MHGALVSTRTSADYNYDKFVHEVPFNGIGFDCSILSLLKKFITLEAYEFILMKTGPVMNHFASVKFSDSFYLGFKSLSVTNAKWLILD